MVFDDGESPDSDGDGRQPATDIHMAHRAIPTLQRQLKFFRTPCFLL